jgi:hypothetical protein
MKIEWKSLAAADDFSISNGSIDVTFPSLRKHHVEVHGDDDQIWRFRGIVAKAAALLRLPDDGRMLPWQLNRSSALVGYRYDQRGRLVGESWVPRNATPDEFQFVVRQLATECDRMELRITGADEY